MTLSPATDNWFETETAPDLIINVDNYTSVLTANWKRTWNIMELMGDSMEWCC